MVLERAKRLVEHKEDVVILLDNYHKTCKSLQPYSTAKRKNINWWTYPAALYMPKKFFGAAKKYERRRKSYHPCHSTRRDRKQDGRRDL